MKKPNLYDVPVGDVALQTRCGGNLTGDNESCVGFAPIPGVEDGFVVRDTKPEGAGRELRFTKQELVDFAKDVLADPQLTA